MIPKLLHYCWFGASPFPKDSQKFIEGWKELMPDYDIKCWYEDNIPHFPYVEEHLKQGNYAFASDYIRLWVLKEYGGIYLDTDFELLKPLDGLLGMNCFVAFQYKSKNKYWVTNGIIGSIPNHPFILDCLREMDDWHREYPEKPLISPELTTRVLSKYGLTNYGKQTIKDVTILEKEVFYPLSYREFLNKKPLHIYAQTMAVHHFQGSWLKEEKDKGQSTNLLKRLLNRLKRLLTLH